MDQLSVSSYTRVTNFQRWSGFLWPTRYSEVECNVCIRIEKYVYQVCSYKTKTRLKFVRLHHDQKE